MSAVASVKQNVMICPACAQPIDAHIHVDVQLVDIANHKRGATEVPATATITGYSIRHDCAPRVTR